jgi:hypothetical protein
MKHLGLRIFHELTILLLSIACVVFSIPKVAEALEMNEQRKNFKLFASAVYQFDANLDRGRDFKVNRYFLGLDWNKRISDTFHAGLSFHYDLHDYSFSGPAPLENLKTLKNLQSLGLGTRIMYSINEDWRVVIIPSIESSAESDADLGDSLIYGGILSASYRVNPDLMIGAGVGIFNRLEEISYFPLVVINWKISEHLRLSNPFSGGPTGPAGLEFSYILDKSWEIACGGAYRSFRFRLNDEGIGRNGIFQEKAVPVWGRVTWRSESQVNVDLNAGAFLSGKLKIEDQDGHQINEDHYDVAPFVAVSVSLTF